MLNRTCRSGWPTQLNCAFLQEPPGCADVPLVRIEMPDSDPDDHPTVKPRMGEEHLAGVIDRVDKAFVGLIQFLVGDLTVGGSPAKADHAERHGCHSLEVRVLVNP